MTRPQLSINTAFEGGILPGEISAHAQPEDFQADLPMETPPIAAVAPLITPSSKAKRATLPKNPTIDDIPAFEKARDKARSRMRSLVHFQQTSAARAVNRRVLEYQRIIDDLKAKQAALQPSLLEHQPAPEPNLPPSQAVPDSGSLPARDETIQPAQRPIVPLPMAERGAANEASSGVAAASAAGKTCEPPDNLPASVSIHQRPIVSYRAQGERTQLLDELRRLEPSPTSDYARWSNFDLQRRLGALKAQGAPA